ncbi:tyrosine-type recombinase/integrase [Sporosarcina sp. NCCP-2331]|uniref:tyrosine-type recombinase/integrase n=1 Tax=Sporosarcina sp. NCCP-2331 TaxID=2934628 RepID=UPI0020410C71|nr:tyrosine-type recombinase/integrase [Sporosarcina sp. NCCP-2331]
MGGDFLLLLSDLIEEHIYHAKAENLTKKTIINKTHELGHLCSYLQEKRAITELDKITVHDLRSYFRFKQKQNLQPQSIVTKMKLISAFFNWCIKEEYIEDNPMRKVDRPKVQKKVLEGFTQNEVAKMVSSYSYQDFYECRNKAIVAMLADCGLRAMELRGLTIESVRDTSILVNGKGNKERVVYISPTLKKILIRYERMKKKYFEDKIVKSNHYFLSYQGDYLSHMSLDKIVKEAGRRAGIGGKRVSPHSFRHFYAVTCITNNIDVYTLSRLLGHSEIGTTQRYLSSMTDLQIEQKAMNTSPLSNLGRSKNE